MLLLAGFAWRNTDLNCASLIITAELNNGNWLVQPSVVQPLKNRHFTEAPYFIGHFCYSITDSNTGTLTLQRNMDFKGRPCLHSAVHTFGTLYVFWPAESWVSSNLFLSLSLSLSWPDFIWPWLQSCMKVSLQNDYHYLCSVKAHVARMFPQKVSTSY